MRDPVSKPAASHTHTQAFLLAVSDGRGLTFSDQLLRNFMGISLNCCHNCSTYSTYNTEYLRKELRTAYLILLSPNASTLVTSNITFINKIVRFMNPRLIIAQLQHKQHSDSNYIL